MNLPEADHIPLDDGRVDHVVPLRLIHSAESRPALPTCPEAEESVVGGVLLVGCYKVVSDILEPADFYAPQLQAIYVAMGELHQAGKPIDIITVAEQMRQTKTIGKLRAYHNEAYLVELSSKIATVQNITHHAQMVRDKALHRRLIMEIADLSRRAHNSDDVPQLAVHAQKRMSELSRTTQLRFNPFDKDRFLQSALSALSRPIPPKLPFGFGPLDEALVGGFPSGSVFALCAPPKHMKTAFIVEMIARWAAAGQRVVYITAEHTQQEMFARLSAHQQFGTVNKWHTTIRHDHQNAPTNLEPIKWMAGLVWIISMPDEEMKEPRGLTWLDGIKMCSKITPPPLVVLDYVEEFADRSSHDQNEQQANKYVMRTLKNYAAQNQARVMAVCSVSRGTYSNMDSLFRNPNAKAEDFAAVAKHSGYIDYAATGVLALQFGAEREKLEDPETKHPCVTMRLHLALVREGTGPATTNLLAFGGYCRFVEDGRTDSIYDDSPDARVPGIRGEILRELAKEGNEGGQVPKVLASLIRKRVESVAVTCKEMAQEDMLKCYPGRANSIRYVHPKFYRPPQLGLKDDQGGWN